MDFAKAYYKGLRQQLFEFQDRSYRDFHASLMPTVDKEKIIGIRVPILRKFAKEYAKKAEAAEFLSALPHKYYEENNLHAFIIEKISDFDEAVKAVDDFLPYIDNWATCDMMSPKVFAKHPEKLLDKITEWISSGKTYTVRFGIGMLMRYFLDERFDVKYLELVSSVKSDEYYVNTMVAWFFATALAKQYETAVKYIEHKILPVWTHNKAIQKSVESYRITDEQKKYLKMLKANNKN